MSGDEKRIRLVEAAAALLGAAPDRCLKIVSLNKGLFYLDLASLRDHGETFTHNTYVALEAGPVIAKYKTRLIRPLVEDGIAKQDTEGRSAPVSLLRLPKFVRMTDEVAKLARKVAHWCSGKYAEELSRYSHKNPGWLIARDEERHGNGEKQSINMFIAMQQILDRDPWLDEPISESIRAACKLADSQEGEPW